MKEKYNKLIEELESLAFSIALNQGEKDQDNGETVMGLGTEELFRGGDYDYDIYDTILNSNVESLKKSKDKMLDFFYEKVDFESVDYYVEEAFKEINYRLNVGEHRYHGVKESDFF